MNIEPNPLFFSRRDVRQEDYISAMDYNSIKDQLKWSLKMQLCGAGTGGMIQDISGPLIRQPLIEDTKAFKIIHVKTRIQISLNRWRYYGDDIQLSLAGFNVDDGAGTFSVINEDYFSDLNTGTRQLFNLKELLNTGDGVEGNMVDIDDLEELGTFSITPWESVPVIAWKATDEELWIFNDANTITGVCS